MAASEKASEQKAPAYDPMKNLPNRKDPETARLLEHYAEEMVVNDQGKMVKKFELCPVCKYAMALRGDPPRLVCAWEPLHTPAKE